MLARRSSRCSAPTQRIDKGGSPPSVTGVSSAFTTGPRTVERIVSVRSAPPRTRMDTDLSSNRRHAPPSRYSDAIIRLHLFPVQIPRRGHVVGNRPGDRAIAAPPHARKSRMPRARRIPVRPMQRILVPRRRHPERLMRITAQDRRPALGPLRPQRPVVAARRIIRARRTGRGRGTRSAPPDSPPPPASDTMLTQRLPAGSARSPPRPADRSARSATTRCRARSPPRPAR